MEVLRWLKISDLLEKWQFFPVKKRRIRIRCAWKAHWTQGTMRNHCSRKCWCRSLSGGQNQRRLHECLFLRAPHASKHATAFIMTATSSWASYRVFLGRALPSPHTALLASTKTKMLYPYGSFLRRTATRSVQWDALHSEHWSQRTHVLCDLQPQALTTKKPLASLFSSYECAWTLSIRVPSFMSGERCRRRRRQEITA